VTAAAGGLGSLFVQEAAALGATVVALAGGAAKIDRAQTLGAGIAIDYLRAGWSDEVLDALAGRAATVVLDGVGGAIGRAAFELLGPGGRLVRFGWSSGASADISPEEFTARGVRDVAMTGAQLMPRRAELEAAALRKAATSRWQPIVQDFALTRAADAHDAIETRASTGKVVLIP
jgi:NADPH2:quinone reductase